MKRKLEENRLPSTKILKARHDESNHPQFCCLLDLNYSSNLLSSKIADIPHKLKYETILAPIFEYCFGTSDQDKVWEELEMDKYEDLMSYNQLSSLSIINLKIDWIRDETFLYNQIFNLAERNLRVLIRKLRLSKNRKFILNCIYSVPRILFLSDVHTKFGNDREIAMAAVKYGPNLEYVSNELKNDKEIVKQAVADDGMGTDFAYASKELKDDKEMVMLALESSSRGFRAHMSASKRLRNDRDVVYKAVSLGLSIYYEVSEQFNNDRELILMSAKIDGLKTLEFACSELRNDKELVLQAVQQTYRAFYLASDELKNDREFMKEIVKINGKCLQYIVKEFREDLEIAELALKSHPDAIYYIPDRLRKDTEFISSLIGKRGFEKLPEEFSNDREIVLESIKLDAKNLKVASMELQNDREFILQVASSCGLVIGFVKEEFKSDREIIMKAVTQNGSALDYVSDQYFDDKEIILKSVENMPKSVFYGIFNHFSERLQNDRELLMKCGVFFTYFPRKYQLDREIAMECLKTHPDLVLRHAYPLFVSDRVLAMRIAKQNGLLLKNLPFKYRNDRELVSFAIQQNKEALKFASDELQNNFK